METRFVLRNAKPKFGLFLIPEGPDLGGESWS